MKRISWDDYFMSMVYLIAMRSKDIKTHVGAVVVGSDNEIRSTGYNSFPRNVNDDVKERQERPEKYKWFAHGEFNSVCNAALVGVSLKGCRMYTNGIPCNNCALSIIQAGISEVIVDKFWDENNYNQWIEEAKRTKMMFNEAGVKLRFWAGELISEIYRFRNGEKI
jgi:dCMP deaminase